MITEPAPHPAPSEPETSAPGIVLVPHTHWDREWYEPHEVFRLRLVHVIDEVIARLEADPDFRFTLDGQAAAIQDYLEIRPLHRKRVESLVRGGQLAVGPFLILLDEFCCDGETIVRNLELGMAAAGRLGAAMEVGYLPDMFGHTAQMPQILRGFGIKHAALWRGVPDAVREHAFVWSAPDGSVVRCEYLFDGYGSALDMFAVEGQLAELSARYRRETRSWYGDDAVLGMLGTDHSAPAPDLMARVRSHNARRSGTDAPGLAVATLGEYLREQEVGEEEVGEEARAALPVVRGELRSHARGNLVPGVFSIRTNLKAAMARAELALTQAERLDALYGTQEHRAFFDLAWSRVVESTAHDSITGCGVDETADQVAARLASAAHIGRAVTEHVVDRLAETVPADAHLVVNTLPWPRTVQAEVVVAAEENGAASGPRTQVLGELETELGDERMISADLVKILRRIHGRELFGQLITGYTWGEDVLLVEVAEVAEGPFDLAALTAEINAAMDAPDAGEKTWRVVTTARHRRRMLLEVAVPALGHVAFRPDASEAAPRDPRDAPRAQVRATATELTNDLIGVVVDADGTLTLTGADGTVLRGVGRLVDEGDRGDSYNFGPLGRSAPLHTPAAVTTRVLAAGPVRGVVEVERRYALPVGVDPQDRDRRLAQTADLRTRMLVEVRAGEPFVRLSLGLVNTVRDHRLRLHVPLGERVEESFAAGQFAVTRRGRTAEGGWGEYPLATFPATGFVSAGSAHVLLDKLTEYEITGPDAPQETSATEDETEDELGDELALTVLRAVGMMSVNVHPLRDEPAGSQFPVPGAQYLGTAVATRLAVLPRSGGWEQADVARCSEIFRHEAVVRRGTGPSSGPLPVAVIGLAVDGPAVLSSLRQVGDVSADGGELEVRLVSVSTTDAVAGIESPQGRQWLITDLRGRPLGADAQSEPAQVPLPAASIRTLRARFRPGPQPGSITTPR